MEEFDAIDEHDAVTGVTTKEQAHRDGVLHRIVAVYVLDEAGRLYVQHHEKSGLLDHTVGGHVVAGESYDQAAAREAAEEVNLTEDLQRLDVYLADERLWSGSAMRHMQALYECQPSARWKFRPNDEVRVLTPMHLAEVVRQMNESPKRFTPGFIRSMECYIRLKDLPLLLEVPELHSL